MYPDWLLYGILINVSSMDFQLSISYVLFALNHIPWLGMPKGVYPFTYRKGSCLFPGFKSLKKKAAIDTPFWFSYGNKVLNPLSDCRACRMTE